MKQGKIKNVIFDIGKVLIRFEWMEYMHSLFHDPEMEKRVTDVIWNSGWWQEFDRGVLAEEEIFAHIREEAVKAGVEKEHDLAFERLMECMDYQPYAVPWVKELKEAGFRVYYLSNYSNFLIERKPEILNFREYMDGGVFSYEEKLIKPDPAIYKCICEKYQLKPEECVFIDDIQKNIDAARDFGMQGIRFDGYERIYPVLMKYLSGEENGSPLKDLDSEGLAFDGMDWSNWDKK